MEPDQDYALLFDSKTYPASSEAKRDLTININSWNTNRNDISIPLEFSTTPFRYLSYTTIDVMQYMLTYNDMSIYSAARIAEHHPHTCTRLFRHSLIMKRPVYTSYYI